MDSEQRKEFFNTLAKFVAVQSVEPAEILDRLARREPAIERSRRVEEPDIGADLFRVSADVETRHRGGPAGRLKNGRQETEGGGLSGAIGAEQPVDLAGLAAESDVFNHRLDESDFN